MHRALAFLSGCLLPLSALAAGPGEMALTAGPGLALGLEDTPRAGAAADARFLYGLSDSWSARVGLAGGWMPASGQPATRIVAPTLGVTVAADVLNLVPFAEAGMVVGDLRGGGRAARQRLGGQLGAGVEYLATRHFTVSLLGRVDYLGVRLAGPDQTSPLQLTLALHLGCVFGP
jgi:hypothetical protein